VQPTTFDQPLGHGKKKGPMSACRLDGDPVGQCVSGVVSDEVEDQFHDPTTSEDLAMVVERIGLLRG
jgi:hypothetical protein